MDEPVRTVDDLLVAARAWRRALIPNTSTSLAAETRVLREAVDAWPTCGALFDPLDRPLLDCVLPAAHATDGEDRHQATDGTRWRVMRKTEGEWVRVL